MKGTPLILLLGHSVWVLLVTGLIWRSYEGPGYQEVLQGWALVYFVDLPVGGVIYLLEMGVGEWLYHSTPSGFSQIVWPAFWYLVLGGAQWWLIGWVYDHRKEQPPA